MAGAEDFDPRFALPAIDDPPLTEIGVMLMGLDGWRLLAGLGRAGPDDDAGLVALAVDESRHGVAGRRAFAALVQDGAAQWLAARPVLAAPQRATSTPSAAPRRLWESALDMVTAAGWVAPRSAAVRAYLAACWVRREDVDACVATRQVPEGNG